MVSNVSPGIFLNFASKIKKLTKMDKYINRIKAVLAEKHKTNKWLAEQLGCAPTTVSKWCTNTSQPDLETTIKISQLLGVNINDLINNIHGTNN